MPLPGGFISEMEKTLGPEQGRLLCEALLQPPAVGVRLNSRKPVEDLFEDARRVAWCPEGRYLESRPVFTLDPLLHAGAYYVQDPSSMIHAAVVKRLLNEMPERRVSLLDLCAAPGGKTTAMIDALPDGSTVVANEYVSKRAAILRENLAKWGYPAIVTNFPTSRYAAQGEMFDIVAVDAPCSGEGMMRKDADAISQWSPDLIQKCAALQREILTDAVASMRPGGFLIYSTCTFNRVENEENAAFIRDSLGLIPFDPEFPEEWGIPRGIDTDLPVYRFMPHVTEGEGLFLSVFRKSDDVSTDGVNYPSQAQIRNSSQAKARSTLTCGSASRVRRNDIKVGKKEVSALEIEDVLSVDYDKDSFPFVELDLEQALAYLRREAIVLPPETPKGIVTLAYKGLPLGQAKNIGSRANNLYPKNWRILMR